MLNLSAALTVAFCFCLWVVGTSANYQNLEGSVCSTSDDPTKFSPCCCNMECSQNPKKAFGYCKCSDGLTWNVNIGRCSCEKPMNSVCSANSDCCAKMSCIDNKCQCGENEKLNQYSVCEDVSIQAGAKQVASSVALVLAAISIAY